MKTTALNSLSLVLASSLAVWAQEAPAPAPETSGAPVGEVAEAGTVEETATDADADTAQAPADEENAAEVAVETVGEIGEDSPAETTEVEGVVGELAEAAAAEGSDTVVGEVKAAALPDSPPEPVEKTAETRSFTTKKLPGGKLLLSSGFGDKREVKIIDVGSDDSVDAPFHIDFDAQTAGIAAAGPVTFMGVSVSPAPAELSVHLPISKGTGLVVQSVSKNSPAEKAGIQQNDILTKLDDQILIHPTQFSVLITGKKEGDSVKLSLLRKGSLQEVPVTLGKSEGGDLSGKPGTLKFGDVEVQVAGAGADSKPLRTYVKRWALDGDSPQVKELKLGGGAGGFKMKGDEIRIEGEKLKIEGDKLKALNEIIKNQNQKLQADVQTRIEDAVRQRTDALRSQTEALREATEKAAALEKAAAGEAAKPESPEAEAKAKAIHDLEETLRKLKGE